MLFFFITLLLIPAVTAEIGCRDMNDTLVDWFIFYKLPADPKSQDEAIVHGRRFLYFDSNGKNWQMLENSDLSSREQAIAYSLEQYYSNNNGSEVFSMFYNDIWPEGNEFVEDPAIAKGVLLFDNSSGFWLSHSIPQFPSTDSYEFWETVENHHAHIGICVSFSYKSLRGISSQLHLIRPSIYEMNLPSNFATDFPLLKELDGDGNYTLIGAPFKSAVLRSLHGQRMISFAKSSEYEKDIYAELIVPSLGVSLEVQSALHLDKSNNLPSICSSKYEVRNSARTLNSFVDGGVPTKKDHSKFAVAFNPNPKLFYHSPWICIGSMDRQIFELSRGGGAICIFDKTLWNTFSETIDQIFKCDD